MLSVVMVIVVMLSVEIVSMLNVVAPLRHPYLNNHRKIFARKLVNALSEHQNN
jgi:hypothetical protein